MVKKLVSYDTDTGELSTDVEEDLAQRFGEKLSKADADATYGALWEGMGNCPYPPRARGIVVLAE